MIFTAALLLYLGACSASPASTTVIDLYDAIDRGIVSAEFSSTGISSRNSVQLQLTNTADHDLKIRVAPGFYLKSADPDVQDIMVTRSEEMLVRSGEHTSKQLYGFCTQAYNSTPSLGSSFTPGGYAQGKMGALAARLDAEDCDPNLEQKAIWAMQGEIPLAAAYSGNRDEDVAMRTFLANLRKEEVPDYIADYGDVLNAPLERTVHQLRGRFSFAIERAVKVTLVLKRPDGSILTTYYTDRQMDRGYYSTEFTYAAELSAGTYTFELSMDNGEVLNTSIEV